MRDGATALSQARRKTSASTAETVGLVLMRVMSTVAWCGWEQDDQDVGRCLGLGLRGCNKSERERDVPEP